MKKFFLSSLIFALLVCTAVIFGMVKSSSTSQNLDSGQNVADIVGFWKSVDEETGIARCVVAIYPYQNQYFGRIIGTFNKEGHMEDTIYKPKGRAEGVPGNPYYSGLDLIWDLDKRGSVYKGKIMDPEAGNVYKAEVWRKGADLIVRGKLLFFGRSQTWLPTTASDFPKGFKKPDTSKFVPAIFLE
jgi:uncharacterized protein (DUF2147 family)